MEKREEHSFLQGPIFPALLKFAIPILMALFLQALYGAVDLWAVGRFCDEADISAVSTGSQTMLIITSMITGLSMGTTILLGQRLGEKNYEGSCKCDRFQPLGVPDFERDPYNNYPGGSPCDRRGDAYTGGEL